MQLVKDSNGQSIQAFKLENGKVNKTTGTLSSNGACCVSDGSITLATYSATIDMVAGDLFTFDTQDVTVVSGKFHLA